MFDTQILINMATISIDSGVVIWESDSDTHRSQSVTSDGTARNIIDWMSYIRLNDDNVETAIVDSYTFSEIKYSVYDMYSGGFSSGGEEIMDAIGITSSSGDGRTSLTGTVFGTYRLPLQGVDHPDDPLVQSAREQSKVIDYSSIELSSLNESFESVDWVATSYEGDFDVQRWRITVEDFPYAYRQQIIDFLKQIAIDAGDTPPVALIGEGFYILSTQRWKILTKIYKGVKIQAYTNKYVTFSLGIKEVL